MSFKQFCEQLDADYVTLPTHTPTRWLTLNVVLERMINLWEPLKAHFSSLKHPPRILSEFFKSDESLVVLCFLNSALLLFEEPILPVQNTNVLFPQLTEIVSSFKCKVVQRQISDFFGARTSELLRSIDDKRAEILMVSFREFYNITLQYIDKWLCLEKHPTHMNWTMLRDKTIEYKEVKELAKQLVPEIALLDELFDEVSTINAFLKEAPDDFFKESAEDNWVKIFTKNTSFPLLYQLISVVFSIPVSNACVERIFLLVSAQWTKDRNKLSEKTVKSILQVKINLDMSCCEMYNLLSNHKPLLVQIVSSAKYDT